MTPDELIATIVTATGKTLDEVLAMRWADLLAELDRLACDLIEAHEEAR